MKLSAFAIGLLVLFAVGCGSHGSPQFSGQPASADEAFGQCAFCHNTLAASLFAAGGHGGSLDLTCESCHEQDLTPGFVGPGHRSIPACADCHTQQMTHHDPEAGTAMACLVCHTPHATANLRQVRESIQIPSGETVPIVFTNEKGLADGGFASVSHPGTGVCEVCHTTTAFYRSDGTGESHYPYPCVACHPHSQAFEPQ